VSWNIWRLFGSYKFLRFMSVFWLTGTYYSISRNTFFPLLNSVTLALLQQYIPYLPYARVFMVHVAVGLSIENWHDLMHCNLICFPNQFPTHTDAKMIKTNGAYWGWPIYLYVLILTLACNPLQCDQNLHNNRLREVELEWEWVGWLTTLAFRGEWVMIWF